MGSTSVPPGPMAREAITQGLLTTDHWPLLQRLYEPLNFIQAGAWFLLCQAREFAVHHDEIVVSGQHQLFLARFDDADAALTGSEFEIGYLQEKFDGRGQGAESVAQFGF